MDKKIVIIGASGHGKVVADIAKKNGYTDITFLDDDTSVQKCGTYLVVGTSKDLALCRGKDVIVAIGNAKVRRKLQNNLIQEGLHVTKLVHPDAVIGENVTLGDGTVVMAGAVINPNAKIGQGCIINTCASVDHDCVIGEFVHISVGSHIAGTVRIGDNTWVGIGAVITNNVEVPSDCMIGAGAVVIHNLEEAGTYIGVPARKMKVKAEVL